MQLLLLWNVSNRFPSALPLRSHGREVLKGPDQPEGLNMANCPVLHRPVRRHDISLITLHKQLLLMQQCRNWGRNNISVFLF